MTVILEGPEGEQFNTYTTQRYPLGTQLIQQDGRVFRFCLAGGTSLVRGDVQQGPANISNHVNLTAAAMAISTRAPTQLLAATAAELNEYQHGYLQITVTPDGGSYYVIAQHDAVASSGTLTANLAQGHRLQAAWTTSTRTNFIHNLYRAVIQVPITTITMALAGVAVGAITNAQYGWIQTRGPCAVYTSGTLILGNSAAYIQVAAALGPPASAATDYVAGEVMRVGGSTAWSLVNLNLA